MDTTQLKKELRTPIDSLDEAHRLAHSALELLEYDQINEKDAQSRVYTKYKFFTLKFTTQNPLNSESQKRISRPVNSNLFLEDKTVFTEEYDEFKSLLHDFDPSTITHQDQDLIQTVSYTLAISIGVAMDFLLDQQGSRKNFGERFDDTVISIFEELDVTNSAEIKPFDQNQLDIIISPYQKVRSSNDEMDPDEVVVSIKTTSKDRLKNIYSDKSSLERTTNSSIKWTVVLLYDVQRNGSKNTDYAVRKTFVPGRFEDLQSDNPLDGIYYIDPPRGYQDSKYGEVIGDFDQFICSDLWNLL